MKHKNYLLIISFAIIILAVPLMGLVSVDDSFSVVENRNLQRFPVLDEGGIRGFTSNMENYAVDQFPRRDNLLDVYTKLQLMSDKIKIRNTLVLENWMFVRDYKVNERNLNDAVAAIGEVVNQNKDVDFHYVILPSKTAMLADLYPKYMDGSISRENNEMLSKAFGEVEGLGLVNVFDAFIETYTPKERESHYYQTDFHWNAEGAFRAFEAMIVDMVHDETFEKAELKLRKVEFKDKYFKGDLERRFSGNIKNTEIPSRYELIDTADLTYYTAIGDQERVERKEIIADNLDKTEIGYNDIFTYNLSCIRVVNKNPIIDKKVLILKDSYFNAMIDPISAVFGELIIIDPRYYSESESFKEIIDSQNPDCVFFFYHQSNVDKDLALFLGAW